MAERLFQNNTTSLKAWTDPQIWVKADIQAEIAELDELLLLSQDAKDLVQAQNPSYDFWAYVDDRWNQLKDILDFFDYDTTVRNLTVADGAWFTPEAIESFCGEDVAQPATLSIDSLNSTYWEHDVTEAHEIVYRLRSYKKRMKKVRIRHSTALKGKLDNLTVYAANTIGGLSDEANKVIDDISPTWTEDDWNEFVFDREIVGKFVKLTGFGSANVNDYIRLQEIDVWVETQEY